MEWSVSTRPYMRNPENSPWLSTLISMPSSLWGRNKECSQRALRCLLSYFLESKCNPFSNHLPHHRCHLSATNEDSVSQGPNRTQEAQSNWVMKDYIQGYSMGSKKVQRTAEQQGAINRGEKPVPNFRPTPPSPSLASTSPWPPNPGEQGQKSTLMQPRRPVRAERRTAHGSKPGTAPAALSFL